MSTTAAVLAALPLWIIIAVFFVRAAKSRSLDEFDDIVPADGPLVSVIIPARNEERNIERCARSVLASRWRRLELLIVDDHSTDRTGEIARTLAAGDDRVRVVVPPPLPPDWMGKQWACWTGAGVARGELLLFIDADTWQTPDMLPRSVNALAVLNAAALTVSGVQSMETFWERIVQPAMFSMISGRFGGTESINRSRRAEDRIANGQCILFRRDMYDRLGGHESVRGKIAEDLALAQRAFRMGTPIVVILGIDQFATRMYASLGEIIRGWSKNMFAGAREAAMGGRAGRAMTPLILPLTPLLGIIAPLAALAGAAGLIDRGVGLWGALATLPVLLWYFAVYRAMRQPVAYAFLFPLANAVVLWIVFRALARGRRVEWKDREYDADMSIPASSG